MNSQNPIILCVDDEEANLKLLENILVPRGYAVVSSASGAEALLKIKSQTIDLVLLDIIMPGMDGFEVCRQIKKDQKLRNIPVIMITILTAKQDRIRGIEAGAEEFLSKPFDQTEVLTRIKILLKVKELNDDRERAQEALQKSHDELDCLVQERTAELAQANAMLQADISELRRAEQHIYRTTRALKTLGHCNQALVRATDESALLQDICRIIVEVGGYRLAWVGFAEHDDAKTVRPVAQVGCEEGYLEKAHITWADEERGRGPSGTAIREGRICIAKSILEDPLFAPWRDEALKRGYKSSVALPLSLDGTVGVLNIFAPEPDAFAADEVTLLTEMAADLSYGIKSIRSSEERKKSEEKLRQKVEELERFRSATVQREFRIRELKDRVKELEKRLEDAARSSAGK